MQIGGNLHDRRTMNTTLYEKMLSEQGPNSRCDFYSAAAKGKMGKFWVIMHKIHKREGSRCRISEILERNAITIILIGTMRFAG